MVADQAAEFAVVFLLIGDDLLQNGDAGLVSDFFELLALLRDVAALVDFQAAKRHAWSADARGQCVGIAASLAFVLRNASAQFTNALGPGRSVTRFGISQIAQNALANGVGVALGKRVIRVEATHLRLPILREGFQKLAIRLAFHQRE